MNDRALRLAGGAGIVFVVLILVGVFGAPSPPAIDAGADEIRKYFTDHRAAILIGNFVSLVGIPLVLWFAIVLRDAARGDRTANALGTASLAGLLVTAPMAMAGGALNAAPVYVDGFAAKLSDDTVRMLYVSQALLFTATSAGLVLFALAAALLIRRTGVLPSYTMWLALLATLGNVLAMFASLGSGASALGLAGVLTFALFVLVSGITMAAGKTTVSTPAV